MKPDQDYPETALTHLTETNPKAVKPIFDSSLRTNGKRLDAHNAVSGIYQNILQLLSYVKVVQLSSNYGYFFLGDRL